MSRLNRSAVTRLATGASVAAAFIGLPGGASAGPEIGLTEASADSAPQTRSFNQAVLTAQLGRAASSPVALEQQRTVITPAMRREMAKCRVILNRDTRSYYSHRGLILWTDNDPSRLDEGYRGSMSVGMLYSWPGKGNFPRVCRHYDRLRISAEICEAPSTEGGETENIYGQNVIARRFAQAPFYDKWGRLERQVVSPIEIEGLPYMQLERGGTFLNTRFRLEVQKDLRPTGSLIHSVGVPRQAQYLSTDQTNGYARFVRPISLGARACVTRNDHRLTAPRQ